MGQCLYEPVKTKEEKDGYQEKTSWKPLLRQVIVCSGIWNAFFICGLCHGAPTVTVPQLRREANSTDAVSEEMASWLSSVHGYAAIPWFILPLVSARIGRKYPFFFVSCVSLVSFVIFYCSTTTTHMLIAAILQGCIFACQITISISILIEYTTPKHRGLFLTLKSASMNWGMWVANALGTFFHWRTIAVAGIICSLYNILTTLFWCESPSWLASKCRFEECARAHRWIKGKDAQSEEELAALTRSCQEYQKKEDTAKQYNFFTRLYRTVTEDTFYKPIAICLGLLSLYHASGKLVCSVYAIDVIKKITSSESDAYMGMLLLDGITVSGMYFGSFLARYFKRRTLLLTGSSGGITFLLILAVYLFLSKENVVVENKYVSLSLLVLFFLFLSGGPIVLCTSIYGELMPLRFRTAGMFITGLWAMLMLSVTLKTAPAIFRAFGLHGAFLFYGVTASVMICFLYKFLPETKDKTLQEIEEGFKSKKERSVVIQSIHSK